MCWVWTGKFGGRRSSSVSCLWCHFLLCGDASTFFCSSRKFPRWWTLAQRGVLRPGSVFVLNACLFSPYTGLGAHTWNSLQIILYGYSSSTVFLLVNPCLYIDSIPSIRFCIGSGSNPVWCDLPQWFISYVVHMFICVSSTSHLPIDRMCLHSFFNVKLSLLRKLLLIKKEGTPKTFLIVSSVFSTPLNGCNGFYGLLGVLGRLRCSTASV